MGSKRVNVKAILADADLRRMLMVSTIQATQAREGIDTTEEQAERAYYVATELEKAAFFGLDRHRGRGAIVEQREATFVSALRGQAQRIRYDVPLRDFSVIEGAPLAFASINVLSPIFRENLSLFPRYAKTRIGHQTFDDDRFVRWWWEINESDRGAGKKWPPFAKGGRFSRFYSDVSLVVRWDEVAHAQYATRPSNFNVLLTSSSTDYLYRPGLTWPRAASVFNVRKMPRGCVFSDKGPAIFPEKGEDIDFLSAVLNSEVALFVCRSLSSRGDTGGRWEAGIVRRVPIPTGDRSRRASISNLAVAIESAKADWDHGNETATVFRQPWLMEHCAAASISKCLDGLALADTIGSATIEKMYAELNRRVYELYAVPPPTQIFIKEVIGEQQREVLWSQMEGKSVEQKRMEHIWRLLSYAVKRVLEADDDGIVSFNAVNGEPRLVERVRHELATFFPRRDANQVEVEIVNELKRTVKGYRKCASLDEWLDSAFFEYHVGLYRNRPIFWHIASTQGTARFAFGALVDYHRFDKDRMAKLRASYLRDAIEEFRREAGLADKAGRSDDRQEWQAKGEEAQALDRKLQLIQEGHHEGAEGGDRDYRIMTPWKEPHQRPKGWDPDLDDGVKVNVEPFEKAGALRTGKVS